MVTTNHATICGLWSACRELFWIMSDFECFEGLWMLAPIHIYASYPRPGRALVQPLQKIVQFVSWANCRRLDRTVGKVMHPAGQAQPFGLYLAIVTETDALNAAMNDCVKLCLLRHAR